MKILFISDNFFPETNAAASRVYERAKYWVRAGHDVTVLTSNPNFPEGKIHTGYENRWRKSQHLDGIRVVRLKTFIAKNVGVRRRMVDFLSFMFSAIFFSLFEKRPDVVVATSPQFFAAVAGYVVSLLKWRPLVLEIADLWPESVRAVDVVKNDKFLDLMEWVELFLYRRAKAIIPLTESFKKNMVSRGIPGDKIYPVPNGVEIDFFRPPVEKDRELIQTLNLEGAFVVGYLGTLGMAHDLARLIPVAKAFQDSGQNVVHFLLVGTGAEKRRVQVLASEAGLTNMTFVDRQTKSEIRRYWSLCDLGLVHLRDSPAFRSVTPSKIFEAMAQGIPLLYCGPESDGSRLVEREKVGVHVPPGNPLQMYDVIRDLMKSREDSLFKMKERALLAVPKYTREAQAVSFIDVLQKTLKTRG